MRTLTILFILLCILSCKKESSDITLIGNRNKNFVISKLNPEIIISGAGEDSLDLNNDGIFDIKFYRSPIQLIFGGYGSESGIIIKNGFQIALSNTNKYPAALSKKTILDDNLNWSVGDSLKLILQGYNCGTTGCPGIANFINVSEKYIGFRNGEKYGWIKVDNTVWELKIKEYTIL